MRSSTPNQSLTFIVPGTPLTFSGSDANDKKKEHEWKEAVMKCFETELEASPVPPLTEMSLFEIGLHFFRIEWIRSGANGGPDLDNLAKIPIDAIFSSIQKNTPGQDDKNVIRLCIEKTQAKTSKEERVEIALKIVDG